MKEYFSHDYNARTDRKLTNLTMQHGMTGIGVFWCIVEMLYENNGILPTEYARIAFELRADNDLIKSVINDFELFIIDGETFYSESVNNRLEARSEKSRIASENVQKRWDKYKSNTPVLQPKNKPNTIKVKESKVKESYKYSQFYDDELKNSTSLKHHSNYLKFVQKIYGEIGIYGRMEKVLKIKKQLNYLQFEELIEKSFKVNISLMDLLERFDNYEGKYKPGTIYKSLDNWLNPVKK